MEFQKFGNPYRFIPSGVFGSGVAASLPEAYRKFYYEWNETPMPVHYIPRAGRYHRDELTGLVTPVQNVPLKLKYPAEFDKCLLGGEAVIKGFYKSKPRVRKFPHFWIPTIRRMVIYSEILNKHMEVLATDRVLQLIHHYKGFDEYIMQVNDDNNQVRTFIALQIRMKFRFSHDSVYFPNGADKSVRFENEIGVSDKTTNDPRNTRWHPRMGRRTR